MTTLAQVRLLEHPRPTRGEPRTATGKVTRRMKSSVEIRVPDGILQCWLSTGLPKGERGRWSIHPEDLAQLVALPADTAKRYRTSAAGVKWEGV